jgi:hypothetical protein
MVKSMPNPVVNHPAIQKAQAPSAPVNSTNPATLNKEEPKISKHDMELVKPKEYKRIARAIFHKIAVEREQPVIK